jgi:putative polyketide hydroxylase
MTDDSFEVLVVGGSMVGLATAVFLRRHGIRVLVVERQAQISAHPRAQAASPRSMELFRALGLEAEIRARETADAKYGDVLQVSSLAGAEIGRFPGPFQHDQSAVGTTGWTLIGQDQLEPVLLAKGTESGAEIWFGTELIRFAQDNDGVDVVLRDTRDGAQRSFRVQYMIAADGVNAETRTRLGIGAHGRGTFGRQMSVIFHAPLEETVAGREFFLCFVSNEQVKGVLGNIAGDRWVLALSLEAHDRHSAYTREACVELVRAATGVSGLPVAIESWTSWEIAASVADRFRSGRVLLAGDCAHIMPPTGGFGGNMGVQDGHNLAWKLALILRGLAGPALLDSYEHERIPVAEFTVDQGVIRYLQRSGLDEAQAARHQPEPTVLFGHIYRSSAILADSGSTDDGSPVEDPTRPSGRPGTRAPHVLLHRDGHEVPVHDLLDGGFWLIAGPDGKDWEPAVASVAAASGIRLDFHRITGGDGSAAAERFATAYGVGRDGAALIRPDGFIAWRARQLPSAPLADLRAALDQVCALGQ